MANHKAQWFIERVQRLLLTDDGEDWRDDVHGTEFIADVTAALHLAGFGPTTKVCSGCGHEESRHTDGDPCLFTDDKVNYCPCRGEPPGPVHLEDPLPRYGSLSKYILKKAPPVLPLARKGRAG